MAKNTRGRRKKSYERNRSRIYEWGSPTFRLAGDLCLLGAVLVIVAVAITHKTPWLATRIFTGCFLFFGLSELMRSADNRAKGGPKKTTVVFMILGIALIAAGLAFFLFINARYPLPA